MPRPLFASPQACLPATGLTWDWAGQSRIVHLLGGFSGVASCWLVGCWLVRRGHHHEHHDHARRKPADVGMHGVQFASPVISVTYLSVLDLLAIPGKLCSIRPATESGCGYVRAMRAPAAAAKTRLRASTPRYQLLQ